VLEWERAYLPKPKKVRHVDKVFKSMLIIFCAIKGIVYKELAMAAKTVNLVYKCEVYGNCVKMFKDFYPNFGDKRPGCCIMKTYNLIFLGSLGTF
jgi:hypothetical protein